MGYNEADTRSKLIDPTLYTRGWTEPQITREVAAPPIDLIAGKARRRASGRIDYLLRVEVLKDTQPVVMALIEAKAEDLPPDHGLEQAKAYADARRLNVPFVYATNGHQFVEFDRFTKLTSAPQPLSAFPSPAELRARYEARMGFNLSDPAARPLLTSYTGAGVTRRYYQDAAIRAVFEKVARNRAKGEPPRVLLSLATGAGKTFIAVHLLKRIADAGEPIRALFVCDREELRTQAAGAFQNIFGANAAVVSAGKPQKNARILIATYQTLDVADEEGTANFLAEHYPENFFTHIIIDECHRSAWGKWSEVLSRNPAAVQIGLTATPRQLKVKEHSAEAQADAKITADNIRHFGEPVYEYSIGQGIEDGYLAACEIRQSHVSLDGAGVQLADVKARNPVDAITGRPIGDDQLQQLYQKTDFEDRLLLPDRIEAMCRDLFDELCASGGPHQKTIIFCVRDLHAERVATLMNNLYVEWCAAFGQEPAEHYAFKCTAASHGNDYLADLRGSSRDYFVATTVDLLTTGVDVPAVRNIVFFRYVRSPISFYQMVGRGTRLDTPSGKLMFRVHDYTNATRLFGEEFITRPASPRKAISGGDDAAYDPFGDDDPEREPIVQVAGFDVQVTAAGRLVLTQVDGKAMPVPLDVYKQQLAERLLAEAPTLDAFRALWVSFVERNRLLTALPDGGRSAVLVRVLDDLEECDLYDVLAELGYGLAPRTREERAEAFAYKHAAWLSGMPANTAATVTALAGQFARAGIEELENPQIFNTPAVKKAGGLRALQAFGRPLDVLRETKERLFTV